MFSAQFFQGVEQDLFLVEEVRRIHDLDLGNGEGRIAAGEFFHVVVDDLVRRQIGDVGTGFEHFHAVFFDVYASDVGQFFGSFAVSRRAGRRTEEDRIGNDGRQEQAGNVFGDVDLSLFIQARYDGCRAADGFEEDGNRAGCFQSAADAVMVDDADDRCFVDAVDDLFLFVVVDEDDLLFFDSSDTVCTDHADVFAVFDDSVFAISRDIMAVIGRLEEQFIGELAFFDDADELAVIGNGSDIAFVGCEPFGSIFQAGTDRKGFDFRVDSFADFDVEVLDQWLRSNVEIIQGKGRFLIRFASADRRSVDTL